MDNKPTIAFIGFGEAGQALAEGFREEGIERLVAWDLLFPEFAGAQIVAAAQRIGVRIATSAADAVAGADLIFAPVTAASSTDAASSVAAHLTPHQVYIDVNSVSPARKQEAARLLGATARYVDMAIMAPVHPAKHKTPTLVAGPHGEAMLPVFADIGMKSSSAGSDIGAATAIKMIRSVMVKGTEALHYECFLAARKAGVEDRVLASLAASYPTTDWDRISGYNLERMASHGIRRAAEMREVAATLRELGVEPLMATATVERQQIMGDKRLKERFGGKVPAERGAILDALTSEPAREAAE